MALLHVQCNSLMHAFFVANLFKIDVFERLLQKYYQSAKKLGARHFVGPDLCPNRLQRLSADDTSR